MAGCRVGGTMIIRDEGEAPLPFLGNSFLLQLIFNNVNIDAIIISLREKKRNGELGNEKSVPCGKKKSNIHK